MIRSRKVVTVLDRMVEIRVCKQYDVTRMVAVWPCTEPAHPPVQCEQVRSRMVCEIGRDRNQSMAVKDLEGQGVLAERHRRAREDQIELAFEAADFCSMPVGRV